MKKILVLLAAVMAMLTTVSATELPPFEFPDACEQFGIGCPGVDGQDGLDGEDGKDGLDGQDGKDGLDGQDGQDGVDGLDGQDGEDGKDGETGATGDTGDDGSDGIDGIDGTDGTNHDATLVEELQDFALDSSAGNTAMASIDFGTTCKGKTEVGVGVGYANSMFGSATAGAIGVKHGIEDNTAGIVKVWATGRDSYGAGAGLTYAF